MSITVTDNHGIRYTARILRTGDAYGNGGTWGDAFYQDEVGITIDGLPCTYNLSQIAGRIEGKRVGAALSIDSGQGWSLTEESTLDFFRLADSAATPKPEPRYYVEEYRNEHGLNDWERRTQFLVFDRRGVGCMTSLGSKSAAQLIVDALNAYKPEGA